MDNLLLNICVGALQVCFTIKRRRGVRYCRAIFNDSRTGISLNIVESATY